ncbi:hypothetical protein ABMY21_15450, partial [Vibrio vulnificus]
PLASDALAIRIVFPLVRVTPFSFKWTGLPALLGKQQKRIELRCAFLLPVDLDSRYLLLSHQ